MRTRSVQYASAVHGCRARTASITMRAPWLSDGLSKDLGYPCMKPDSEVLASAASLGIVATKRNYNDSDRRVAVETLQRCCIPLRTEMAVLDLYLLINGGMFWARQFVRSDYYA